MGFLTERKQYTGRVLLPLALFVLAGCSSDADAGYTFPSGLVDYQDKVLTVYLESDSENHPQWSVDIEGEGLELVSSEFKDETTQEIGPETSFDITVVDVFTFESTGAGNQVITFTNEGEGDEETIVYTMDTKTNSSGAILSSEIKLNGKTVGSYQN